MKNKVLILLFLLFALFVTMGLTACTSDPPATTPDGTTGSTGGTTDGPGTTLGNTTYSVTLKLTPGAHLTVSGASQKLVKAGGTVEFVVRPDEGYALSCSAGDYDAASGKLTVSFVMENTTIELDTTPLSYTVRVPEGAHYTVSGDTEKQVNWGKTTSFTVTPEKGYYISAVSAGSYNAQTGKLTVTNVKDDITITVTVAERDGWAVSVTGSGFTADKTAQSVKHGGTATFVLTADAYHYIMGVSEGVYDPAAGTLTVENVTDDITVSVVVEAAKIVYHVNDGTDTTKTDYPDFTFYACPNTRWDNGTLSRSGYALVAYNTKADGTGESYSLGSKVYYDPAQPQLDLYCVWLAETPASEFDVSGGTITGYRGSASTVVIPTRINGTTITAIAAGAFSNNTAMAELVLPKTLQTVASGAFVGCSSLVTLYCPDSIASIPDDAFDSATYSNLHHFYLNATMAPRWTYTYDGMYRAKWDHVMAAKARGEKVMVLVAGSSAVYGFSAQYMEKLMDGEYTVVNFGTICTTAGRLYVEALATLLTEDDILIWAPEASTAYQMGSGVLDTFKIFRDTEGMYNVYRAVDIAHFSNYFAGITDYNSGTNHARLTMTAKDYNGYNIPSDFDATTTPYDFTCSYPDKYAIINYYGDLIAGANKNTTQNKTPGNKVSFDGKTTSESINGTVVSGSDITTYAPLAKAALKTLSDNGVGVYFGFCPVNEKALIGSAATASQQSWYDAFVAEQFGATVLGSCTDHVFTWNYFTSGDSHHLIDKGTQLNTYRYYTELCAALGRTPKTEAEAKAAGAGVPGIDW